MTPVRRHRRSHRERPSIAPSVTPSIAPPDSPFSLESDDDLSDQPAEPPRANLPVVVIPSAAPPVPKYTKKDLQ